MGLIGVALAIFLASCGESSPSAGEQSRNYKLEVVNAQFPAKQQLGETALLRLGIRNSGKQTVPFLTVSISIAGKEGQSSALPFGIRDPEPGLAQPDRPVWVLAAHYPKLAGDSRPGGTSTSSQKTFDFGPLKPGATVRGVWKLSAVKAGHYDVLYAIGAGLTGVAKAKTASGVAPGGTFSVQIAPRGRNVEVTDSGQVVEIHEGGQQHR